ncbi:hypothetical protein [Hymenobacter sp.]|uniref:hypothetical protein n=1 Tax=Hymenobacter sp. TaxID=1898978 RepID=UPI00286C1E87|nr:hypothetical protein [Hymenobacter sp.]
MENSPAKTSLVVALWNAAKWVLGILLAGTLTMGSANLLMHRTGAVDLHHLTWFEYWVKMLTVPALAFGLFVFLACAFVPTQKKRAGLLVVGLSLVLIGLGIYQHVLDDGFLETQYVVRYTVFIVGLAGGFWVSHHAFKGNKWT